MSKQVVFDQVYWFLYDCPLKRRADLVIEKPPLYLLYREILGPVLLSMFKGSPVENAYDYVLKKLKDASLPQNMTATLVKASTIMLTQSTLMIAQLYSSEIVDEDLVIDHDGLLGEVDLVRLKQAKLLQMVWFDYRTEYPSAEERVKLYMAAQWNGRLYELSRGKRPFQLTYFMPMLGEFLTFTYNPEAKLEAVAELIRINATPGVPGPGCDTCSACPMQYTILPTVKGEYDAHRY